MTRGVARAGVGEADPLNAVVSLVELRVAPLTAASTAMPVASPDPTANESVPACPAGGGRDEKQPAGRSMVDLCPDPDAARRPVLSGDGRLIAACGRHTRRAGTDEQVHRQHVAHTDRLGVSEGLGELVRAVDAGGQPENGRRSPPQLRARSQVRASVRRGENGTDREVRTMSQGPGVCPNSEATGVVAASSPSSTSYEVRLRSSRTPACVLVYPIGLRPARPNRDPVARPTVASHRPGHPTATPRRCPRSSR